MTFAQSKLLATRSYAEFNRDQCPRLGAALAYYTALSIAPLLILLIAVVGLVFGKEAASGQLYWQINDMVGPDGAKAIQGIVDNASKPTSGVFATLIGFATLVFGASSVAAELKASMNAIWNVPVLDEGIKDLVKYRSSALMVVLGCGFLLVVSLAASSFLAAGGKYLAGFLPFSEIVLQVFTFVLSLAVITGVFAVLYRFLPDVHLAWGDVLLGAAITALLFTIGKSLISIYLGKAGVASTYGAAGSVIVVLVWVYYSAQIFFLGAEFTQVYSEEFGSDPQKKRESRVTGAHPKVQPVPKPVQAPVQRYAAEQAGLSRPRQNHGVLGAMGTVVGSLLAFASVRKGLKK
jgi:membrane protein